MVIFGGGVAGLWLRASASLVGARVVLLTRGAVGAGQTVLSQGILHSGLKYAFGAAASAASRELMEAREVWDRALGGGDAAGTGTGTGGVPDLSRVRVLAPRMHMWTSEGFLAKFTAAVAASVMRSGVRSLAREEFPAAFAAAPKGVSVWEVQERAVDAASLIHELSAAGRGPIWDVGGAAVTIEEVGEGVRVCGAPGGEVVARHAVLCAGAGNETLLAPVLAARGVDGGAVFQRRPLHMVYGIGAPVEVFGHCVQQLSDKPRLTVTTSPATPQRGAVWYLGGELAEGGVDRDGAAQVHAAKAALAACLGWIDTSGVEFRCVRVDRAEGKTADGSRPDGPIVRRFGSVLACWPTKLALAPLLARRVLADVGGTGERDADAAHAMGPDGSESVRQGVAMARPPWDGEAMR